MAVKDFSFNDILNKIKSSLNKEKIWEIFLNTKYPVSVSKNDLEKFLKDNLLSIQSEGIPSITEFIGRFLFCENRNYIPASAKECYSTEHGAEGFFYDYNEKQLYVYEAKSTSLLQSSIKHSHDKVNEANDDLKTFGKSRTKKAHINSVRNFVIPGLFIKNSNPDSQQIDDLADQLELISIGKPRNAFIAAHYNGDKDACDDIHHQDFKNNINFSFKLKSDEFKAIFKEMLGKIQNG